MVAKVSAASVGALFSLGALDRGEYADAIAHYENFEVYSAGNLEAAIWRAEVATYLYRIDEALEALDWTDELGASVAEAGGVGHLARRRALLLAEIAPLRGEPEAAKRGLEAVLEHSRTAGDVLVEMRARLNLARVAKLQDEWSVVLARAAEAARLAAAIGNDFYRGCALWNRGVALYEMNSTEAAETALREAVALLTATENLRFRALAQNNLAGVLVATDKLEEVWALYDSAEAVLLRTGIINDSQIISHGTAWALFAAGRYEEARERVEPLGDMDRAGGDSRAELFGLKLLACLASVEGRDREALRFAAEHARLAGMSGSDADRLEARLLLARANAKAGSHDGIATLRGLVDELDGHEPVWYATLARLFLANALVDTDPVAAGFAVAEAREHARGERVVWVRAELAALERNWTRQPIRFVDGRIVVNLAGPLPLRAALHAAVDRALIAEALKRTDGSFAKAGRLIGEQRWNTRHLAHNLGVVPPGPVGADGRAQSRESSLEESNKH